jgi:hypothetical protein
LKARRTNWTDALVAERLQKHVERLGRMPTASELRQVGDNALGVQISRRGGFRHWAEQLGAERKPSETLMGRDWEEHESDWFAALGFNVKRMTVKSPYDLRVDQWRVDVKAAHWTDCGHTHGYVFAGLKRGRDADWFDLVCIEDDRVAHRYVVPGHAAGTTLTITPRTLEGRGKYSQWAGALHLLHPLQGAA